MNKEALKQFIVKMASGSDDPYSTKYDRVPAGNKKKKNKKPADKADETPKYPLDPALLALASLATAGGVAYAADPDTARRAKKSFTDPIAAQLDGMQTQPPPSINWTIPGALAGTGVLATTEIGQHLMPTEEAKAIRNLARAEIGKHLREHVPANNNSNNSKKPKNPKPTGGIRTFDSVADLEQVFRNDQARDAMEALARVHGYTFNNDPKAMAEFLFDTAGAKPRRYDSGNLFDKKTVETLLTEARNRRLQVNDMSTKSLGPKKFSHLKRFIHGGKVQFAYKPYVGFMAGNSKLKLKEPLRTFRPRRAFTRAGGWASAIGLPLLGRWATNFGKSKQVPQKREL